MNILLLTLSQKIDFRDKQSIYGSILGELNKMGHTIVSVSPNERRYHQPTTVYKDENVLYLNVKTGNIQKTNTIEKGISTILLEKQYKKAIKKHTKGIKFDLILYSTPPITFCNVIRYFKKRDDAKTYLMLKDIFPQNAVDLNYFSNKSIIYKYFRNKEINLYKLSDKIGCMSPANKDYLLKHNPYLDKNTIEVFPNSIIPDEKNKRDLQINSKIRKEYGIPKDAIVFMYGGNLGKPQGIDFLADCLKEASGIKNAYFVICGAGTEYHILESVKIEHKIKNLLLINGLPKDKYTELLNIADVGLIFLDNRFTIPNFPSRLLSYCEKGIPILCCTDKSTDIGKIATSNGFGWKCESGKINLFVERVNNIIKTPKRAISKMGGKAYLYLIKNYNSTKNVEKLIGAKK